MTICIFDPKKKKQKNGIKMPQSNRTLSEQEIKEFTTKFNEVAREKYLRNHKDRIGDER